MKQAFILNIWSDACVINACYKCLSLSLSGSILLAEMMTPVSSVGDTQSSQLSSQGYQELVTKKGQKLFLKRPNFVFCYKNFYIKGQLLNSLDFFKEKANYLINSPKSRGQPLKKGQICHIWSRKGQPGNPASSCCHASGLISDSAGAMRRLTFQLEARSV